MNTSSDRFYHSGKSEFAMSTNTASLESTRDGALWVVQVLGATLFFIAGFAKLSGDEQVIQTFDAAGISQWFRYVTGFVEFASAILLLIPALSGIGVLLLVTTMIGAILTHLLIIGGSPALPIGLLMVVSIVAWGRKEPTLELIRRNRSEKKRNKTLERSRDDKPSRYHETFAPCIRSGCDGGGPSHRG